MGETSAEHVTPPIEASVSRTCPRAGHRGRAPRRLQQRACAAAALVQALQLRQWLLLHWWRPRDRILLAPEQLLHMFEQGVLLLLRRLRWLRQRPMRWLLRQLQRLQLLWRLLRRLLLHVHLARTFGSFIHQAPLVKSRPIPCESCLGRTSVILLLLAATNI